MRIVRSNRPYQEIHTLLKSLQFILPDNFREYEEIEWEKLASHSVLTKMNYLIMNMSSIEKEMIISKRNHELPDRRWEELSLVFWILAKIQSDQDMMEFLKKG
jgi:hypothetical protein